MCILGKKKILNVYTAYIYIPTHTFMHVSVVLCYLLLYEQLNQNMFYYRISQPNYIQLCECSELFLSKKLARGSWLTTYLGLFSSISFSVPCLPQHFLFMFVFVYEHLVQREIQLRLHSGCNECPYELINCSYSLSHLFVLDLS